jgi:hypothetical protein
VSENEDRTPTKTVLVPPRPNLGPEPMPEDRFITPRLLAWLLASWIIDVVLLLWFWRRLRRRGALRRVRPRRSTAAPPTLQTQTIAWSRAVREALAARFGPSWCAKTTEEIAAEPALAERLGAEPAARLVAFLAEADRAKFADTADLGPPEPPSYFAWLDELLVALRADAGPTAGARSRISG